MTKPHFVTQAVDGELLARWGEYAAFGQLFRSHESNQPEENRQVYDPDEADTFARNSRLFAALAPFREQVLDEAERTGLPVMRHSWIHLPTGEPYDGDTTATVSAPIGTPAAFIAAGHPMASDLTAAVRAALGG